MKCLTFLFLKFLLFSNFVMAETIPTKSKILKEASYCIKNSQAQVCRELISEIEKLQLLVFDQNRFKCQSSLLGCLLYTSPSPRDRSSSRMPSSA